MRPARFKHFYYELKPWLPWSVRIAVRRRLARHFRRVHRAVWPILPGSEKPPAGWPGWPEGKQFALVLTHDVEGPLGLRRVRALLELERQMGLRALFNFIPEGPYRVPRELREAVPAAGSEVGVHGLYHDGRLYRSREVFRERAARINRYLKDWNAVGFRSPFMHHNLDWLRDLEIEYDSSTFDTDPFEPQPDGVDTIFPFWVAGPNGRDYLEIPYTLPQDSTLFLLLREKTIEIWKHKLDWIAQQGGMVVLDTHPDYMNFDDRADRRFEYPVAHYRELLAFVQSRYAGAYWQPLPRELTAWLRAQRRAAPLPPPLSPATLCLQSRPKPKIWIDLDNTPHVPFFEPIIEELRRRGYPLLITARDAFQVCDLADQKGLPYLQVGRHHGKNRILKVLGLFYRALQLAPVVLREQPVLGVSHGARSQIILSHLLHLPTVLLADYEFAQYPPLMRPTYEMAPEVVPNEALSCPPGRVRKYPGIKEDVYAWKLRPDPAILTRLGLSASDLIITVRPPANEAHYHNPESEKLLARFMDRALRHPEARIVLLPRNKKQAEALRRQWPAWFADGRTVIPAGALDGLNLLWHSDLVVSGGGTMNREAAALGVPVYSIFRGRIGAVDRHLQAEGRLVLIQTEADADEKIRLVRRPRRALEAATSLRTLHAIVEVIEEIARHHA